MKAGKIAALGICVDANPKEVKQTLERDGIEFSNVCDGKLLNTPLLKTFGLNTIPDNIVIRNGKSGRKRTSLLIPSVSVMAQTKNQYCACKNILCSC